MRTVRHPMPPRTLAAAAAVAMLALASAPAGAALLVRASINGVALGMFTESDGQISATYITDDLTIKLLAQGAPSLPNPAFQASAGISSTSGQAPKDPLNVKIEFTQTDASGVAGEFLKNLYNLQGLGVGVGGFTVSTYLAASNIGFDTSSTPLGSNTFSSGNPAPQSFSNVGSALDDLFYSQTFVMETTITGTGLNITAGARLDPTSAPDPRPIPEPAALALVGAGLLGLLLTRRQRDG